MITLSDDNNQPKPSSFKEFDLNRHGSIGFLPISSSSTAAVDSNSSSSTSSTTGYKLVVKSRGIMSIFFRHAFIALTLLHLYVHSKFTENFQKILRRLHSWLAHKMCDIPYFPHLSCFCHLGNIDHGTRLIFA